MIPPDRAGCAALDRDDPLAPLRDSFVLPDDCVYLDGNSLGALPRAAAERVARAVDEEWGRGLIRSWNNAGWIDAPARIGDGIGRLVGSGPGQVVVTDSTSVNLFKLVTAGLAARPGRRVVLTQADNFPTDLYIAEAAASLSGATVRPVSALELEAALDAEVAVLMLTHVHYTSGRVLDMERLTAAAHRAGALTLWDLSHTVPVVDCQLDRWEVDLATGCGYKHLSGGPGAPAFVHVAQRLQDQLRQPLAGWMGHAAPFDFDPAYRPAVGIGRLLCGTPPVLSAAALEAAVGLWETVDLGAARSKARALGDLFLDLLDRADLGSDAVAVSPRHSPRGAHVSVRHPQGYQVMAALIAAGVVGDVRPPGLMRFGFSPLTTRYVDVWDAVECLRSILADRSWDRVEYSRSALVT